MHAGSVSFVLGYRQASARSTRAWYNGVHECRRLDIDDQEFVVANLLSIVWVAVVDGGEWFLLCDVLGGEPPDR